VALTDVHDRVVRVNKDFTRIFGYSPDEAFGQRLSRLIAREESQKEVAEFGNLVRQGKEWMPKPFASARTAVVYM
jgi:PAS domain S-box-containing protein